MTHAPVQLPLGIRLLDDATLGNFFIGLNRVATDAIQKQLSAEPGSGAFVFLWGAKGSGKSHLLQAACHLAAEHELAAIYLPLKELADPDPEMLDGLEYLDLVCIDDVQAIAGDRAWEEGLFNLYNRCRESGSRLLIGADEPPRGLQMGLPDLISRLSQCLVIQLQPLEPDQCIQVFLARARNRGIEVPDAVEDFIARRSPRDIETLMQMLDQLDQALMVAKRRLTVPFVKQTLGW